MNISEESKTVQPGRTAKTADKLPPPPGPGGSGDQERIHELNKQIGVPLPTSFVGHEYIRGIQSVLNSIEKDPLRFWKKKVSVYKTMKSKNAASLFGVFQNFRS